MSVPEKYTAVMPTLPVFTVPLIVTSSVQAAKAAPVMDKHRAKANKTNPNFPNFPFIFPPFVLSFQLSAVSFQKFLTTDN
jgi:hypothetical protein